MREKVLLANDANTALMMETMILAKRSFDTILARDGVEAIAKAQRDNPDILLDDMEERGIVQVGDGRPFIDKIVQDTRDYVQALLDEVRRLSRSVAELDVELSTRETMASRLKERVAAIEAESRQFAARYVEVEQQNSNLANLYVASYQLHGTRDRHRIMEAIKEIVINLIGSEELLVWERDGDLLRRVGSFGVDEREWEAVRLGEGIIGLCAETGERFITGQTMLAPEGREETLTACIPLKLDETVVGAIAIFRLFPQKGGLAPVDHELFDLLASHAASALYCTRSLAEVAMSALRT